MFLLYPASTTDLTSHEIPNGSVESHDFVHSFITGEDFSISTYLIAKQSRDACFGGVAYGCEVVTALQGEHQPPACQTHQLPGQVAEAWTGRK